MMRLIGLRKGGARTYARRYLYPKRGIGEIFERMSDKMIGAGGELVLGARVMGLERFRERVVGVRYQQDGVERHLACDAVISTLALPLTSKMLADPAHPLPTQVRDAGARLRFRAIRLVNVLLDMPEVSPHTWMYVSEPHYLMSRIQEPRQRSPYAAPPGKTSLMLEIPCDVGDATWTAPDESLYARCMSDLKSLGFHDVERATLEYFSSYVEEGYPIYHLDYQRDRDCVLAFTSETKNLISCGRQGAFRYIFMDTAMEMGLAAARSIIEHGVLKDTARRQIANLRSERGLVETQALTA